MHSLKLSPAGRVLGQYRWHSDTLRLNPRYLARLSVTTRWTSSTPWSTSCSTRPRPLEAAPRQLPAPPGHLAELRKIVAEVGPMYLARRRAEEAASLNPPPAGKSPARLRRW